MNSMTFALLLMTLLSGVGLAHKPPIPIHGTPMRKPPVCIILGLCG